ncbi:hypothetical protein Tco_0344395 [Tanacetum coccineum]
MENANPCSTSNRESLDPKKKKKIKSWLEDSRTVDSLDRSDEIEYLDTFPTLEELEYHVLYLMRKSLEVLRKFHCMILGGRFNQLSHVSSPLLSKPGEY